ncbi:MAG TPA: POTRA domain-containing protein [Chitinophagaceae bacterium]|nr:POTRA domain-containing protein [Chitinophagaceae bacterium]
MKAQVWLSDSKVLYSTEDEVPSAEDSTQLFTVKQIIVEGNRQTKPATVLRELTFQEGGQYSLPELVRKFSEAKKQLMNTALFHEVVVSLKSLQGYDAYVEIGVRERWYIFPFPFVKTVDRSFGEWIKEQNMDWERVNYGVKITHNNFTGRNDKLSLNFMNGYTKQLSLSYRNLILDKDQQWTSSLGFATGKNRQLDYITTDNKRLFFKNDEQYVHSFTKGFAELSYRRAIKTKHTFGIGYTSEAVPDTILTINPQFSPHQQKTMNYPEFYYKMYHFNVDYIPYPTKGYAAEIGLYKRGINNQMNLWQLTTKASATWPLTNKYFLNIRTAGGIKVPFRQPYINQQFLGFNDMFMQGYEYFVVNGVAGGYTKVIFSRELVNTKIRLSSERIKKLNNIPIRVFGKIYGNSGYVYNPLPGENMLCNRMLYSGGVGLDIITFYDFIFRVEWSFNQLGQNDLYLHRKNYF